jgi:peptidoglycan/xylan/chitin deacetylase (PgdA/CDA1 family)
MNTRKMGLKRSTLIWIVLLASFTPLHAQQAAFIFRMDDVVLQADSMQDKIMAVFQKHDIPLSWGVIPFAADSQARGNADKSYINTIQNAVAKGELELLLHGLSHTQNEGDVPKSEFAGRSLSDQEKMLAKGKSFIENNFKVKVNYFAPPWNTYDKNTLVALQSLGFEGISADLGGLTLNNNLAYLPCTKIDFTDWDRLLQLSNERAGVVVVLFHTYTFSKDTLLSRVVANGNPCYTFSSYTRQSNSFPGSLRYQLNAKRRYSKLFFFLPDRAQQWVHVEPWQGWIIFILVSLGLCLITYGCIRFVVFLFYTSRKTRSVRLHYKKIRF